MNTEPLLQRSGMNQNQVDIIAVCRAFLEEFFRDFTAKICLILSLSGVLPTNLVCMSNCKFGHISIQKASPENSRMGTYLVARSYLA